eukprot:gene967-1485_t
MHIGSPRAFDGDSDDDALDGDSDDDALDGDSDDDALDGDSDDNARSTGSPSRNFRNMSFAGQSWKHPRALQVHGGIHGTKSFFVIYDESNGDAPDANAHFFRATGLDMVARPGHDTPIACQWISFNGIPVRDLKRNRLSELDLTKNEIGTAGVMVLAKLVALSGSLITLILSESHLGGSYHDDVAEGFEALGMALKENKSLTALKLDRTEMRSKGAAAFASGLAFNTSLITLDLSGEGLSVMLPVL